MDTDQTQEEAKDGRQDETTILEGFAQGEYSWSNIPLENVDDRLQVTMGNKKSCGTWMIKYELI